MSDLFSRKRLGTWLIVAGVACVAACLHWVAAYLMLTVGFSSDGGAITTPLLEQTVVASLLLTPLVGLSAVVLATLRFKYTQRWITIAAFALLPLWSVFLFGLLQYFMMVCHTR